MNNRNFFVIQQAVSVRVGEVFIEFIDLMGIMRGLIGSYFVHRR